MTEFSPPTEIEGTPVTAALDKAMTLHGERWVTLYAADDDDRIWEWSLTTGRLLRVV